MVESLTGWINQFPHYLMVGLFPVLCTQILDIFGISFVVLCVRKLTPGLGSTIGGTGVSCAGQHLQPVRMKPFYFKGISSQMCNPKGPCEPPISLHNPWLSALIDSTAMASSSSVCVSIVVIEFWLNGGGICSRLSVCVLAVYILLQFVFKCWARFTINCKKGTNVTPRTNVLKSASDRIFTAAKDVRLR